jgi:hypothetical protein
MSCRVPLGFDFVTSQSATKLRKGLITVLPGASCRVSAAGTTNTRGQNAARPRKPWSLVKRLSAVLLRNDTALEANGMSKEFLIAKVLETRDWSNFMLAIRNAVLFELVPNRALMLCCEHER